ncbi:DUF349 domain-containing protein [Endozoicomonas sp. G2_1]|uniref:DUF349 domain-containing protein n=1 Tax=Endozoicomonas sp. G2_1 TaxID=2821091 RepID=UPI001AD9CADC|nr:DUF349 domain-containing protein [Endozoicomonas sp. G2_1]MBO9490545.1 DUF349 domain-containing protein [Endozoicomonas sp. G2_1]
MIFDKFTTLFRSKWHHKDANIRIQAIEEADPSNSEDRKMLSLLLAEDVSDNVRKSALLKFDDLELYLAQMATNSSKTVKSFAEKQIQVILQSQHQQTLSSAQKKQLLDAKLSKAIVESWLESEQDADTVIALYQYLAKPQLLTSVFAAKQNSKIQAFLVSQTDDINRLEKLAKKSEQADIIEQINDKITGLKRAKEKPEQLRKQIQLLLAKLLALKEARDYPVMFTKREALNREWQLVEPDLGYLPQTEKDQFVEKYHHIDQQLSKLFAAKREAYEQAQIAEQAEQQKQLFIENCSQALAQLNETIANAVLNSEELDADKYLNQLDSLATQLGQSILSDTEQQSLLRQIDKVRAKLAQLPLIIESAQRATSLISRLAQLALPTNLTELNHLLPQFQQWQQEWRDVVSKADGIIPQSLLSAQDEINQQWQQQLVPLRSEQKQLFNQVQRKCADIKRLINQGKFNSIFGIFKGVEQGFVELSGQQQQRLQKDYDFIANQVAELADWEHYVATPKKQELLASINQIVEKPLEDIQAQASKVKAYRSQWMTLGHADDELEKELNQAFNQACELAFAPCREYYAEREAERIENQKARQQIIEQAKQLVLQLDTDQDFKVLEGAVNKLNQQWRSAGEVDRQEYKTLQAEFNQVLAPVKQNIANYHQANQALKESLIGKAQALANNDDVFAAIKQVKQLQQDWKAIGYAGQRFENKLWQQFRQANDIIFAKRTEHQASVKQAQQAQRSEFEQSVEQLAARNVADTSIPELEKLLTEAKGLHQQVLVHKPVIKSLANKLENYIKTIEQNVVSAKHQRQQQVWQQLFETLEHLAQHSGEENFKLADLPAFNSLPSSWQKRLVQHQSIPAATSNNDSREKQTLVLEILAGQASPDEYKQQRMEIQVELMQTQMQSANSPDIEQALRDWLAIGVLKEQDLPLLSRVKTIFIK